jgi:hypothetical protein
MESPSSRLISDYNELQRSPDSVQVSAGKTKACAVSAETHHVCDEFREKYSIF